MLAADPALLVEDHRARDRAGVERAAEGEQGAPGGVEEATGRARRTCARRRGRWSRAGVLGVHPEERPRRRSRAPARPPRSRRLLAARRAPRPPDVEYDDLAGVVVQGELLAVERRPGDLAGLLAVGRGQAGDQARCPATYPLSPVPHCHRTRSVAEPTRSTARRRRSGARTSGQRPRGSGLDQQGARSDRTAAVSSSAPPAEKGACGRRAGSGHRPARSSRR